MTPQEFVAKWKYSELKERSAYQEHCIDLCRLLNHPTPNDDILARLLALNLERAAQGGVAAATADEGEVDE